MLKGCTLLLAEAWEVNLPGSSDVNTGHFYFTLNGSEAKSLWGYKRLMKKARRSEVAKNLLKICIAKREFRQMLSCESNPDWRVRSLVLPGLPLRIADEALQQLNTPNIYQAALSLRVSPTAR